MPEIATVGFTAGEASAAGHSPVVGEFPFEASGRALTPEQAEEFVRNVATEVGRILGGQIVGPETPDLIAEVTLAAQAGLKLEDHGSTIHTHPTLSEAIIGGRRKRSRSSDPHENSIAAVQSPWKGPLMIAQVF
jgi:dihydrolipoamide dehydrogenase